MKRMFRRRGLVSRPFAGGLALFLTLSLTVPAWAVVFTNPASITLNDATAIGIGNPYPATIAVSGLMGTVTSVTVTLSNINHTFPDDFDLLLVGPTGANLILMSDAGGSDDMSNTTITFDDAAANSLPDAAKYTNGSFKPTNIGTGDTWPAPAPAASANTTLAAAFNGTDPNGTWNLYVADDLGVDMGSIGNGWSLTITTAMSSATTFSNGAAIQGGDGARGRASLYASTITASGLTGAITDVNVTLTNLNHLNPDDLDIVLVGPSGKRILLLSDAGGTTDVVNATVTFDDAGAAVVPDAGPLVTATVRPTNFGTGDTLPDLTAPYPNAASAGSATLASVFNGTDPNGTWSLYITDDATTSAGTLNGGWSIDITAGGNYAAKRFTASDFDGDGRTDVAQTRPSTRDWFWRESVAYANRAYSAFGLSGDINVPGDYDGDRKTDIAVWRPSNGVWYIVQSATNTLRQVAWGTNGDTPVPNDYDGDGQFDLAVFRNGSWFIFQSTTNTGRGVLWGSAGDIPVRGHFVGTGGADFAVFRPSDKSWYILENSGMTSTVTTFGATGDILVPGDYDGDNRTDIAVYRNSGDWFIINSSTSTSFGIHLGASGDVPVPGDYDGDSRTDVAVWRPSTGSWFILNSGTPPGIGALRTDNWGDSTDIPVPRLYLPTPTIP
jgi:subtilisin-like proprotein convertase family protein/putative transposon-encoded protein